MKRASYTIVRRGDRSRYYRGAVRIERETVVWECHDEHRTTDAARYCAVAHMDAQAVRPAASGADGATD